MHQTGIADSATLLGQFTENQLYACTPPLTIAFHRFVLTLLGQPLWQATGWRQAACQYSKDTDTQLQQPERTNPQL